MHQIKHQTLALLVFVSRLKLLPANFSPLGSFGFFSQNPTLYFASILLFDYFVGGFYRGFLWVYAGFMAYWLMGRWAQKLGTKAQFLLLPLASLLFFLVSNFGVWLNWYPRTWVGLLNCYSLALPFYTRTLLGDLVFGYGYMALREVKRSFCNYLNTSPLIS